VAARIWNEPDLTQPFNPIENAWSVQAGENALVEFVVSFSRAMQKGSWLRISGPPYQFIYKEFRVYYSQEANVEAFVEAGEAHLLLHETLPADVDIRINGHVATPTSVASDEFWTVESFDGENWPPVETTLPSNTNDGLTESFHLVTALVVNIIVTRSPPVALIEALINIDPMMSSPTLLILVAPENYVFPADCLVQGGQFIHSCAPSGNFEGYPTATFDADALFNPISITFKVRTPRHTPEQNRWYLQGLTGSGETEVAWGKVANSFEVFQMEEVRIRYSAIAGSTVVMAIGFKTSTKVEAGAHIVLQKPDDMKFSCSPDFLFQVSLPGILACSDDPEVPWEFSISVNDTMVPGGYTFAAMVILPDVQPQVNKFSIIVYENDGSVQDACMDVPGKVFSYNLGVTSMPLSWTSSDPGTKSILELGFSIDDELAIDQLFSMIVIKFPDGFVHRVDSADDVEVTKALPLMRDAIVFQPYDNDPPEANGAVLRVLVDMSQEIMDELYVIKFPVIVPQTLPPWNIWEVVLCKANDCNVWSDPHYNVLVSFSVVGFRFGQMGPRQQFASSAAVLAATLLFGILS
jgi:hypothetical protein